MGASESRVVRVFNGTRFNVVVTLRGRQFEYRRDGSSDLRASTSVRLGNGAFVQITLVEKYMEMTIECKDEVERRVKFLTLYTQHDFSWVVRNHGVMRPKPGTLGLTEDEDYSQTSSTYFQSEHGANWKQECGDKIRFYSWDVDDEETLLKKDSEDRDALEEMKVTLAARDAKYTSRDRLFWHCGGAQRFKNKGLADRHMAYGKCKNWIVLSEAHHPRVLTRPNAGDQAICKEFIAALQLYTATMAVKLPLVWLVYWNVESLQRKKDLEGWQIQVQGIDAITETLVFERLMLENDYNVFAMIHIQRGPLFTIRSIQEAFRDSLINQTEVWVADPTLDMRQQDRASRNLRLYQSTDCCKFWVPGQRKYNLEVIALLVKSKEIQ